MGKITRQELAPTLRQELDDVKLYIDGSNNLAYEAHMNDTSNPHGVNASQVGLGNVTNHKQATKTEFDTHVANTSNPHGVTTAQIGAVPTSRLVSTGTGLTGGGSLNANKTLSLDLTFLDDRYLGRLDKARNAETLDGYDHVDFMKHGETYLRMSNNDGIKYVEDPGEFYFVFHSHDRRAYHSGNITFGTEPPTKGKHGDIYIQY